MIFPGLQLLEEPKPGKPLQTRGTRAPPTGETAQGAEEKAPRSGGVMRREMPPLRAPGAACGGGTPARPDSRLAAGGQKGAGRGGAGRRALSDRKSNV